jgi:hypothetical protein
MGEDFAREWLLERRNKELIAMYHLITPDGKSAVLQCPWNGDFEKDLMISMIKSKARELNAIAAMYIAEAWALSVPKEQDNPDLLRPSLHPDRVEIVQIVAFDGSEIIAKSLTMIRDKITGRLTRLDADEVITTGLGGRMVDGIIPPKTVH